MGRASAHYFVRVTPGHSLEHPLLASLLQSAAFRQSAHFRSASLEQFSLHDRPDDFRAHDLM